MGTREPYLIALLVAIVLLGFFFVLRPLRWSRRSHVAQTIEAVAVTLAVVLAGLEYSLHFQGDIDRKKQAVIDFMRATIGKPMIAKAYHELYDEDADKVLRMPAKEFDQKIASLADIFWAVGSCAAAEQCDPITTRAVFCFDFKTFEFAYNSTHPVDKRPQNFKDERLKVFCECENKHQFSKAESQHPQIRACPQKGRIRS